jgi:hypothetical protein
MGSSGKRRESRSPGRKLIGLAVLLLCCVIAMAVYLAVHDRSGKSETQTRRLDRQAVLAAALQYVRAIRAHDGQAICRLLTPAAVEAFITSTSPFGRGECALLARQALREVPTTSLARLGVAPITQIRGSGGRAMATLLVASRPTPIVATRVKGRWLVGSAPEELFGQGAASRPAAQRRVPCNRQVAQIVDAIATASERRRC